MNQPYSLSVITAFYNEEYNLPVFRKRLEAVLSALGVSFELVLVDDHSSDGGSAIAKAWAETDPRVQYIRLSRNCGSHAAFSAGLKECQGECAVLMAADLQDPPETIPALLERWSAGDDVVWAVRAAREGESWSRRLTAGIYYRLMGTLALANMPSQGADFLLVGRKVIDAYNVIREKNTSFLAMILWMGFRQSFVQYVKQARRAGKSKWTLSKKIKLFVDSLVSFSYAPIRLMSCLGLTMALCGFLYAFVVIVGRLAGWVTSGTGYAALMSVLLVGQGSILLMLGILGEYLWRTYDEARGRPRYIVQEHVQGMPKTPLDETQTQPAQSPVATIESRRAA
jgi:dolichol-phosphate mannosyltransferase